MVRVDKMVWMPAKIPYEQGVHLMPAIIDHVGSLWAADLNFNKPRSLLDSPQATVTSLMVSSGGRDHRFIRM